MKKSYNAPKISMVLINKRDIIVTSFESNTLGIHGYDKEYDGGGTIID